jgi:hypothetical protein
MKFLALLVCTMVGIVAAALLAGLNYLLVIAPVRLFVQSKPTAPLRARAARAAVAAYLGVAGACILAGLLGASAAVPAVGAAIAAVVGAGFLRFTERYEPAWSAVRAVIVAAPAS